MSAALLNIHNVQNPTILIHTFFIFSARSVLITVIHEYLSMDAPAHLSTQQYTLSGVIPTRSSSLPDLRLVGGLVPQHIVDGIASAWDSPRNSSSVGQTTGDITFVDAITQTLTHHADSIQQSRSAKAQQAQLLLLREQFGADMPVNDLVLNTIKGNSHSELDTNHNRDGTRDPPSRCKCQNPSLTADHDQLETLRLANLDLQEEVKELKDRNTYILSDYSYLSYENTQLRSEKHHAQSTARKFQTLQGRIDHLQKSLTDRDRFIVAVVSTRIHYPVLERAYEAVKGGQDPETALAEQVAQSSKNPYSPWARILCRIPSPPVGSSYSSTIHLATEYESPFITCEAPVNPSFAMEAMRTAFSSGSTVFSKPYSAKPFIASPSLDDLATPGNSPFDAASPCMTVEQPFVSSQSLKLDTPSQKSTPGPSPPSPSDPTSSSSYIPLTTPSLTSKSSGLSSQSFSPAPHPSDPFAPLQSIDNTRSPAVERPSSEPTESARHSRAQTDRSSQETITPASNRHLRLTSRIPVTPPRKQRQSPPSTKPLQPSTPKPSPPASVAKVVKATFSIGSTSTTSPKPPSPLSIPIRSHLSTPQRVRATRLPLSNVTNRSPIAIPSLTRVPPTRIPSVKKAKPTKQFLLSTAAKPVNKQPATQPQPKPTAKQLGKRRGVILCEAPILSPDVVSTDKLPSLDRVAHVFPETPLRTPSATHTPHDPTFDCSSPNFTLLSPGVFGIGAPSISSASISSPSSESRASNDYNKLSDDDGDSDSPEARLRRATNDPNLQKLDRILTVFSDDDLGSLEPSEDEGRKASKKKNEEGDGNETSGDSDVEALIHQEKSNRSRGTRVSSHQLDIQRLLLAFERDDELQQAQARAAAAEEARQSPQNTSPVSPLSFPIPALGSMTWKASVRRHASLRKNVSVASSSSSGSSASIDSPSKYIRRASQPMEERLSGSKPRPTSNSRLPRTRTTNVEHTPTWVPAASIPQPVFVRDSLEVSHLEVKPSQTKLTRSPAMRKRQVSVESPETVRYKPQRAQAQVAQRDVQEPVATSPSKTVAVRRETPMKFPQLVVPEIAIPEPCYGEISPPFAQMKPRSHTINTVSPLPPRPAVQGTLPARNLSPFTSPTKPRSNTFNTFSPTTRSPLSQHVITNTPDGQSMDPDAVREDPRRPVIFPIPKKVGLPKARQSPRNSAQLPPTAVFMRPPPMVQASALSVEPLIPEVPATPNGTAGTLSTAQCRTLLKRGFKFNAPR